MKIIKTALLPVAAAAALLTSAPAQAESMDAKEYLEMLNKGGTIKDIATVSIHSYSQSLLWTSAYVEQRGDAPIFCMPKNLFVHGEQAASMFRKQIAENPGDLKLPVGMVMLKAYLNTFPCP